VHGGPGNPAPRAPEAMSLQSTSRLVSEESLPGQRRWTQRPTADDLKSLPNSPAVYLLCDADGRPVLLATSQAMRAAIVSRLQAPPMLPGGPQPPPSNPDGPQTPPAASTVDAEAGRRGKTRARADLAEIVRELRWRPVCCTLEARWWYYRLARALYPRDYPRMVAFGPAWFLHVDWSAAIPELRVTQQIWAAPGEFVGSWPAQAVCQQALETLWDLFDLCRYPEQVRRAPAGKRCAYADMGRCDAPCDGSVPLAPYVARTQAAWRFACGAVDEWLAGAGERMRAAAAALEFERAALIRQQIAVAQRWRSRWLGRVRPDREMKWLLVLPVARRRAWKLLAFRLGTIDDGPVVADRELVQRAGDWTRQRLSAPLEETDPHVRMEQTWLVANWLGSRDAGSAVVQPLDTPEWSEQLAGALSAALDRRRPVRSGLPPPDRTPPMNQP
jgi:hypothetical protein